MGIQTFYMVSTLLIILVLSSCQEPEGNLLNRQTLDSRNASSVFDSHQEETKSVNANSTRNSKVVKVDRITSSNSQAVTLPTEDKGKVKDNSWTPKNIDEAFEWLSKTSAPTSRAYKVYLTGFKTLDRFNPDLDGNPSTSSPVEGYQREFIITRWHWLDQTDPCEVMFEYGDIAKQDQKTYSVFPRGCPMNLVGGRSKEYGFNRYGVRKCKEEKLSFLGTKNIQSYVGAFGIRLECKREEGSGIHQIWYHPASNHPFKKVLETGGVALFGGLDVPTYLDIFQQRYENLIEKEPANEFEIKPPSHRLQYIAEGSLKNPGMKDGIAFCQIDNSGNFSSIYIPYVYVFYHDGKQTLHGMWEPSFNAVGAAFAYGVFWNKNLWGQPIQNGNLNLKFEKLGNTMFHRVSISGSVTLMSKDSSNMGASVTAKSFSTFYCFANQESGDQTEDDLRDWSVGDPFNF